MGRRLVAEVPPAERRERKEQRPNRCGCGATWTGSNVSHCGGCHRTFTGVRSFDDHRSGKKQRNGKGLSRPGGVCYDPADTGQKQNAKGRWGFPTDKEE